MHSVDHVAEDMQKWKSEEFKDVIQELYGIIGNALQQIVEHAFTAGWEYRDRRHHAAVGKKKKAKQQEGRNGVVQAQERNGTNQFRTEMASKGRRKRRRVSH